MFKRIIGVTLLAIAVSACGSRVEVPGAHVGKVQTEAGMSEGVRTQSSFRLSACFPFQVCDKIVLLDVSDKNYSATFNTYMPRDELVLGYQVSVTLGINPAKYDFIYANVPPASIDGDTRLINQAMIYETYARNQVDSIVPQIMAQWNIEEVASNRDLVNQTLTSQLGVALQSTPFTLKYAGITKVDLPALIIEAKEDAAKRSEQENTMLAQRNLDLLAIQTESEVEEKRRAVELQKAATQAMIAEEMMSPAYETLLRYETLKAFAASTNKVVIPTEMLDSIAVQNEVAR